MLSIIMVLSIMIVLLGICSIWAIKKIGKFSNTSFEKERYETEVVTDKCGITHTYIFDKKVGHVIFYEKSNGQRYYFKNDDYGRLVGYEDYFGNNYDCDYNSKDQLTYLHYNNTDKKYGFSYDNKGRINYQIDYDNNIGKSFYYNQNNEIYRIENSNGSNFYNLDKMPSMI